MPVAQHPRELLEQLADGLNYYYLTLQGGAVSYGAATASLGQVKSPAETIMLGDGPSCSNMTTGTLYCPDIYTGSRVGAMGYVLNSTGNYFPNLRHNDMANIAYVDGHAKACNMGYLAQGANWDLN